MENVVTEKMFMYFPSFTNIFSDPFFLTLSMSLVQGECFSSSVNLLT